MWSPAVCTEFCEKVLKLIANEMKDINNSNTVYRFYYDPKESVFIKIQIFEDKNEHSFIPKWYIDEIERQTTS